MDMIVFILYLFWFLNGGTRERRYESEYILTRIKLFHINL